MSNVFLLLNLASKSLKKNGNLQKNLLGSIRNLHSNFKNKSPNFSKFNHRNVNRQFSFKTRQLNFFRSC